MLSMSFPRLACVLILVGMASTVRGADRIEPLPTELEGVGITEKLDAQAALNLAFLDEEGKTVKLSDICEGKATLLTLNYSSCPMLCNLQLNGLIDGLIGVPLNVGKDFQIVTVSLDPKETTEKSNKSKRKYLKEYGREGAEAGWHFLTAVPGEEKNIRTLAASVGFGYQYLPDKNEYLHSAAFIVLTPEGRISHYLYGVKFESETLRLSVTQASEGKVGSIMDQMILFCFKYDATKGKYALEATRVMQGGVLLTVLMVAGWMGLSLRREFRRKNAAAANVATAATVAVEIKNKE